LELGELTPSRIADKSLPQIERIAVLHGNRTLVLADFFDISGSPADGKLRFIGAMNSVHRLGERMDRGAIHVEGSIGRHLGAGMTGGEITVEGDAGDFAGCEMAGGTIRVLGDAGNAIGSAYAGSTCGTRGGTILVHGSIGNEAVNCMRRGLVAVGGSAGDYLASDMLAGSVVVFGDCGIHPGANMRRGTIAVYGSAPTLLPTFRAGPRGSCLILRMLLVHLGHLAFPMRAEWLDCEYDAFHGDCLSLGRGEIFVARH